MAKRPGVLEFAVLGILHESPMHGYELRKRCNAVLGSFRAFSYGSLYPCLKALSQAGWIAEEAPGDAPLAGKRSRIVYRLTAEGKERFQELVAESGPSSWEDDGFGVHFAFFARTDAATREIVLTKRVLVLKPLALAVLGAALVIAGLWYARRRRRRRTPRVPDPVDAATRVDRALAAVRAGSTVPTRRRP